MPHLFTLVIDPLYLEVCEPPCHLASVLELELGVSHGLPLNLKLMATQGNRLTAERQHLGDSLIICGNLRVDAIVDVRSRNRVWRMPLKMAQ